MWHWGWGWGHGAYGFPFWWLGAGVRVILIAAVITAVVYVVRIFSRPGSRRRDEESALDILQKRYARGEITKEQYEEMKRDIG